MNDVRPDRYALTSRSAMSGPSVRVRPVGRIIARSWLLLILTLPLIFLFFLWFFISLGVEIPLKSCIIGNMCLTTPDAACAAIVNCRNDCSLRKEALASQIFSGVISSLKTWNETRQQGSRSATCALWERGRTRERAEVLWKQNGASGFCPDEEAGFICA